MRLFEFFNLVDPAMLVKSRVKATKIGQSMSIGFVRILQRLDPMSHPLRSEAC